MRCIVLALWLCSLCHAIAAQEASRAQLPMAWADLFPWFYLDDDGEVTGFAVELAETLGQDVGFEIAPFQVASYAEWGQAQSSGQSVILPAVARLPGLMGSNLLSDPLMETTIRLAVVAEAFNAFDPEDLTGRKIGVLSPGAGSDAALYPGATLIEYQSLRELLMALMAGEIDAAASEATFLFAEARRTRLDDQIAFVGAPLDRIPRYVAVHENARDLMPALNAALEDMRNDGRLEALLVKHSIQVPPPPPDVLRVGVFDLAPHMAIGDDGRASGFAVDVMRDLAELAGLSLEFVEVDIHDFAPGDSHDMLPVLTITDARRQTLDYTYPIESSEFSIFLRASDDAQITALRDLGDRRLAVLDVSLGNTLATEAGLDRIVPYADGTEVSDMLVDLVAGDVDAVLFERSNVLSEIAARGLEGAIVEVAPPVFISQRAPALRQGLGAIRERLNAVIPVYLVSDDYLALQQSYFGVPVFWTQERVYWILGIGLAAGFLLVAGTAFAHLRARTLTAEANARAASSDRLAAQQGRTLETIFNAATSGIVALDPTGLVMRANTAARHMLGGISQPAPFPWPGHIQFVERETMHPLDASADPISRALSGHNLHRETHLLKRAQEGEQKRYVRIDSAHLQEDEDRLVVLVIDDVSNEERNRQAVERKGRLDALGQLTGGIAHDFNNLLTSLLYSIVLAGRATDALERMENLREAEASIGRARSLTSQLMSFASKQPGLADARRVDSLFDDFRKLVRPVLEESITLSFDSDDEGLIVYCDITQLESALMNLVLNSRDAVLRSGKGSRIMIKARAVDFPSQTETGAATGETSSRFVEISVTDDGPGMDAETLKRATDPFFTTKGTNSGTGLGLAMVYGFARNASGDLRIYSEPGVGTTVQLTLPRGAHDGLREKPVAEPEIIHGQGETILLVEDEFQILSATTKLLRGIGYEVVTAASGREALDLVEAGAAFDLLLTDVVMPGEIGGFELAKRVRDAAPQVPVIYLSGYTGFTRAEMGSVTAPLLQKPAPPAELARELAANLHGRA